jgi:cobalt-zinc-cadmium efflux system membrane fusion protein
MKRAAIVLAVVIVAVAAVLGVRAYRARAPESQPSDALAPANETGTVKFLMEQQWAIRMKLARAVPSTVARQVTAPGRIVPAAGLHAVVASPVSGLLDGGTLPRVGQRVARGDALAAVRQTPTAAESAQIAAGQAQMDIERARLDAERRRLAEAVKEAEIRSDHARTEAERARRLHEQKAFALRQVEAAEADYRAADASLAAAIAQRDALRDARSPVAPANAPTASYSVRAPIAGVVVRVAKGPGAQVGPGEPIVEIIDAQKVWLEVLVSERDVARLGRISRATFATPAAPDKEYTATLVDRGTIVNPQSRTITMVFEAANADQALRAGQQATVRLDSEQRVEALLVPVEAVLESEGKRFVYVLRSGEEFERRDVTVGDEYGDRVAILSGLKAGERVVTQGAYQLRQHELRPSSPAAHTHET